MLWILLEKSRGHTEPAISVKRYDFALPEIHLKEPPVIPNWLDKGKSMLPQAPDLARKPPRSYRTGDIGEKV